MGTKNKTDGKTSKEIINKDRVVLNLDIASARVLRNFLAAHRENGTLDGILNRIQKTISKRETGKIELMPGVTLEAK